MDTRGLDYSSGGFPQPRPHGPHGPCLRGLLLSWQTRNSLREFGAQALGFSVQGSRVSDLQGVHVGLVVQGLEGMLLVARLQSPFLVHGLQLFSHF